MHYHSFIYCYLHLQKHYMHYFKLRREPTIAFKKDEKVENFKGLC